MSADPAINNEQVPAPVRPDLSPDVERAIDILGNRVRVAVLRSLILQGPASRTDLSRRLDISVSLLQTHMRPLVELGAVTQEPPGADPDHRTRIYRANKPDVDQLLKSLSSVFV